MACEIISLPDEPMPEDYTRRWVIARRLGTTFGAPWAFDAYVGPAPSWRNAKENQDPNRLVFEVIVHQDRLARDEVRKCIDRIEDIAAWYRATGQGLVLPLPPSF